MLNGFGGFFFGGFGCRLGGGCGYFVFRFKGDDDGKVILMRLEIMRLV